MDYLERKYKGKRKENAITAIYLVSMAITAIAAGMLIFGFLKKDIVDRNILFFIAFFMGFVMSVALAFKSKIRFKYERILWLVIQAIILLVFSIISLLILV